MGDNFIISIYESLGLKLTLALTILFTLIFLLVLISILKKFFRKDKGKKETVKKKVSKVNLNKVSAKSPRGELVLLDKKVRDFFKKKLESESEMTYSEIVRKLKEKNKPAPISFFKEMNYHLYSEKIISNQEVGDMKRKFLSIIEKKKSKSQQKPKKPRIKPKVLKKR